MEVMWAWDARIRKFFEGDLRVKDWPLMGNPIPGILIVVAYVYFVKVAGPRFMKSRQPYDVNNLMLVYNFLAVFGNLWIFLECGWNGWFNEYKFLCQPVDYSDRYEAVRLAKTAWWLYILKNFELMDSIFFVLRKKYNQLTRLHVIHHSLVPLTLWLGIQFAPGGFNSFFPFVNCFVHVIMYSYYGLTAVGPRFRKYLFSWKKYMTLIQMTQFVLVCVFCIAQMVGGCDISNFFAVVALIQAVLFLGLFYNFFKRSYHIKKPQKQDLNLPTPSNDGLLKEMPQVTNADQSTTFSKKIS